MDASLVSDWRVQVLCPRPPGVPFPPFVSPPVGGVCQWRTDFARPVILIVRHTDVRMYSFEELTEYDSVAP